MITAEELRAALTYCPVTGAFAWKAKPSKQIAAGADAGHLQKDTGYIVIKLRGRLYRAHRLAWLYVHGAWPNYVIDHINGTKHDNRIANLRDTTRTGNAQNQQRAHSGSQSGVLGVYLNGDKFVARIRTEGRLLRLGEFNSAEAAHSAYVAAKRQLHPTTTL